MPTPAPAGLETKNFYIPDLWLISVAPVPFPRQAHLQIWVTLLPPSGPALPVLLQHAWIISGTRVSGGRLASSLYYRTGGNRKTRVVSLLCCRFMAASSSPG